MNQRHARLLATREILIRTFVIAMSNCKACHKDFFQIRIYQY
ncbi:hypothetical protein CIPAW_16G015800 [Carya illinoinensis]|uniref:Uncharacterized protein n=1 Tax=Carya illinoinensis TaxID=32201 RepID=A0A8T1N1G7_CARIL|nr:hypothetical protein CIPAW_16G015800 [Carya illinoinensis]